MHKKTEKVLPWVENFFLSISQKGRWGESGFRLGKHKMSLKTKFDWSLRISDMIWSSLIFSRIAFVSKLSSCNEWNDEIITQQSFRKEKVFLVSKSICLPDQLLWEEVQLPSDVLRHLRTYELHLMATGRISQPMQKIYR